MNLLLFSMKFQKILLSRRIFLSLTIIFYLSILLLLFFQAIKGYPLPVGDKDWFYPVIFNLKVNNELSHPYQSPISQLDFRFIWHGFFFPIAQNFFNIFYEYHRVEFSSICIVSINCFLILFLLKAKLSHWFLTPIALSVYLYQIGRPELLVSTVLLIDLIVKARIKNYNSVYRSFISATLFVISPVSSILHYFFWLSIEKNEQGLFNKKNVLYLLLTPFIVYCYFKIFVTGFDLQDWISGIFMHRKAYSSDALVDGIQTYAGYLWGERRIPYLIFGLVYCIIFLINSKGDKINIIASIVFILLAYWFGIKEGIHIYNIVTFIPVFILIDNGFTNKKQHGNSTFKVAINNIRFIFLGLLSVTCFKALAQETIFYGYLNIKHGTLPAFLIKSMQNIPKEKIIELPTYFYFANNKNSKILQNQQFSELAKYSGDIVYISQFNIGAVKKENMPKIPGYCITDYSLQFYPKQALYDWSYIKYEKC
jgi:hypothetical protein